MNPIFVRAMSSVITCLLWFFAGWTLIWFCVWFVFGSGPGEWAWLVRFIAVSIGWLGCVAGWHYPEWWKGDKP